MKKRVQVVLLDRKIQIEFIILGPNELSKLDPRNSLSLNQKYVSLLKRDVYDYGSGIVLLTKLRSKWGRDKGILIKEDFLFIFLKSIVFSSREKSASMMPVISVTYSRESTDFILNDYRILSKIKLNISSYWAFCLENGTWLVDEGDGSSCYLSIEDLREVHVIEDEPDFFPAFRAYIKTIPEYFLPDLRIEMVNETDIKDLILNVPPLVRENNELILSRKLFQLKDERTLEMYPFDVAINCCLLYQSFGEYKRFADLRLLYKEKDYSTSDILLREKLDEQVEEGMVSLLASLFQIDFNSFDFSLKSLELIDAEIENYLPWEGFLHELEHPCAFYVSKVFSSINKEWTLLLESRAFTLKNRNGNIINVNKVILDELSGDYLEEIIIPWSPKLINVFYLIEELARHNKYPRILD